MGEIKNYDDKSIDKLVKEFPIEPLFTRVIITLNREQEDNGLILKENPLNEEQYVLAVGGSAQVKPGQKILLDLEKMTVKVPSKTDSSQMTEKIKIDFIPVGKEVFGIIYDNQIKAKYK